MLRPVKVEKLVKVVEKLGYELKRQKGSHKIYRKGSKLIVIPFHKGKPIKKSLLRLIISQLGISVREFYELLEKV